MTTTILIITALISTLPLSDSDLDSLLALQRERAGDQSEVLFSNLDKDSLTNLEQRDLRFLLAYLPLGDIAIMKGSMLLDNVRLAQEALNRFSWGEQMPDDVYLNFVLPHRVSQEPFVEGWRHQFLEDLTPRVEMLSMKEAALEVNHWCHEHATFVQTTGRDQDPLTTIRSGFGRCEEEMILTICALRSIGIPARQCYTPYWPHTDNNHAWVEVWVDGKWHYCGGCEPKPDLTEAWFTSSAARAMLVVSTAYGKYLGDEPILKKYPRSTLINSTEVYGPPREIEITLVDRLNEPVTDTRIFFGLFNYGAIMPALSLKSDEIGMCLLTCGRGSWIASAEYKKQSGIWHIPDHENYVTLKMDDSKYLKRPTAIDYRPPPGSPDRDVVEMDSLFKCRLEKEKSMREESFWSVWARELGIEPDSSLPARPDSILAQKLSDQYGLDSAKTLEILTNARGNWGNIYLFLTGIYPGMAKLLEDSPAEVLLRFYQHPPEDVRMRFLLLETLKKKDLRDFTKDLRDFTIEILRDHYHYTTVDWNLADLARNGNAIATDSVELERIKDNVITPRISWEPSSGWREPLVSFLRDNPKLIGWKSDKRMVKWLQENIIVEEKPDRLGPGLAPDATLKLRRGRRGDIERLYIGLCRVRGIPARFNPVSNRLEVWTDGDWQAVKVVKEKKGEKKSVKKGTLLVTYEAPDSLLEKTLYMREWSVQEWRGDFGALVDFGYKEPFGEIEMPQELPEGLYCLTTGRRREDGSAPVSLTWFEIKARKEVKLELTFRE